MQVEDMIKQFSTMNNEQLLERIREIRRSRHTKKEVSNKPADRPKTKEKVAKAQTDDIISLFANMSAEDKANIAALLMKGK